MKAVKEVSNLTGISVRTLHYYDEIDLLKPTMTSEAGYRLYDDKALEDLQQILFFREFDMPLKEIKAVMENSDLDRNQLLCEQKNILILKKERLERIITSMERILKGENKMELEIFNETEIKQMYIGMLNNMTVNQKNVLIKQYGSLEEYEKQFMENASGEHTQKNFAKMVEWYGSKENAVKAAGNSDNSKILDAYSNRFASVMKKLAGQRGMDPHSFDVKSTVGELEFVTKQLYQIKQVSAFLKELAKEYETDRAMQKTIDGLYGEGAAEYIGKAVEAYYQ